jgi:two-component system sensor histidine kinase RegB
MTIYKNSLDPEPALPATPDLLHGLGNILQNAFQFAKSKVEVTLNWNRKTIEIVIQDDGPGYPESLLPHLGQPYSSPQGVTGSINAGRQGGHLGLGLFIAQTLLSQRQGQVHFSNYAGARCLIRWPQNNYESALEGEKENIPFP